MNELAPMGQLTIPPEQLQRILKLYDDGLYLQAYHAATEIGPLESWRGADARILAGRLAGNLGAQRLADWHFLCAWRQDKNHPEAMWFYVRALLGKRGPLAAWKFVEGHTYPATSSTKSQSHWYSQRGAILGHLRDFDAAEEWLKKADALGPQPWTCLEWAALYTLEDRMEEAEAAARRALELQPWYRPAVQWVAHFLVQKERDAEAIDLLTQASQRLESGSIFAQLAALQLELKRIDDAARNLDEFERLSPLLEANQRQWLDARRCDLACHRGEFDKALIHAQRVQAPFGESAPVIAKEKRQRENAKKSGGKFYESLAKRLTNRTGEGKRVEIPVGFVRQHHKTCAPATLTSIAKFWSMPAEHVEVAEEISYIGTTAHNERKWASDHGWHAKAFTVTWDAAVALIDRGIPFTLTTHEVSSAHLQAVIGYDSTRGTLILRDPGERHRMEMHFDTMQERYRSTGPRGMALVPIDHKEKLASLTLPDEALYDLVQRFDLALDGHRRAEAGEMVKALTAQAPGHYLTLHARRTLANYDIDQPAGLSATEQLLKVFPEDLYLQLSRAEYLRVLGRRDQRLELLKQLSEKKETDPMCWQFYAEELAADARRDAETLYLLRRAIRATPPQAPLHGRLLDLLARIRMEQRKFTEAMQLHHFAVCSEDKDEYIATNYFQAARARGEAERAIDFLQKRFKRFCTKSSQPARTLYSALMQMERYGEAFDVLNEAMRLRPKDGDLLTYAADAHTFRAEFDEAAQILNKAEGVSKPAARLRSLAYLAVSRDQRLKACNFYEEVLKIEPLAIDEHRWYAHLLAEKEGRPAALRYLAAACQRFPHHFPLAQLHYEWLAEDGPAARESFLKKLIELHPYNAWLRVEYAYILADQDRFDDAHRQLDAAEPLDPDGPTVPFARGYLYKSKLRIEDAQYACREAIRKSVDFDPAIRALIGLCENLQERREVVAFVAGELLRQPTSGNGIVGLTVAEEGLEYFPAEELLACKRRLLEARPDLALFWFAVGHDLTDLEGRDAECLAFAQKAVQRFPTHVEIWMNLGQAHRFNGNADAELQALTRAVDLAPNSLDAIRFLADAHERTGSLDAARKVYEHAIRKAPLLPTMYVELAQFLWRHNEREEALVQVRKALQIDPWFQLAWTFFYSWCMALGQIDELIALAREWTEKRPGNAGSWFRLALALQAQSPLPGTDAETERIDDYVKAYDEAIRRAPFTGEFYDAKAEMLAIDGRFDQARKACNPSVYKGKLPTQLRARAAATKAAEGEFDAARQQIVVLIREDWTVLPWWNSLLDWSLANHEFRELIDVANELCRKRPQSAFALTKRGFGRLQSDDREAGLEDLRNAHRKDACYWPAGNHLFEELLNDEDLAGAEATLLTLVQGGIARNFCYVKSNQVQFHAKRGNQAIALEVFQNLCEIDTSAVERQRGISPVPYHVLDKAMRALEAAGWKKQAEQILCDAMKKPGWNIELAIHYAVLWNPTLANDLPDRIAAIDCALEKQPETFRFLDLKAELLTSGNQFERAWQACKEKTLPQDQFALDGRAAWVMYCSGRVDDAIRAMKDLVKRYPKYTWGWGQLADWFGRAQNWVEVLTVAEQLVVLAPREPVGFGYRGQAKQFLNDPQAARADYLHALDLQPSYIFAAWALFELYVRNSEWQRAEKILDKAKKHADKGEWAIRRVDLLVYQNRKSGFPKEFENLCRHSDKNPMLIHQSLMLLVQVGWWSDAEEVLHRCLDLGAHICDQWVHLRTVMGDRRVASDIESMSTRRPERTNCLAAYANELAFGKDPRGLRHWIYNHEDALREDTPCWAKVGAALAVVEDWAGVCDWMHDWAEHTKATPTMLLPLVKAMRSLDRIDEARKVGLFALTKLNPDFANSFHKVWLMLDQALDGDVLAVQRYLEADAMVGFDGYHQMIASMVRAIWLTTTNKEAGFAQARQLLADTARFTMPTIHDPALGKSYQACVAHMTQIHGTFGAKLWRFWRWLKPTLPQVQKNA